MFFSCYNIYFPSSKIVVRNEYFCEINLRNWIEQIPELLSYCETVCRGHAENIVLAARARCSGGRGRRGGITGYIPHVNNITTLDSAAVVVALSSRWAHSTATRAGQPQHIGAALWKTIKPAPCWEIYLRYNHASLRYPIVQLLHNWLSYNH